MLPLSLPALQTLGITGGAGGSARSGLDMNGASWGPFDTGDFNVNIGGSGLSMQGASSSSMLLIVAAVAALYFLSKK